MNGLNRRSGQDKISSDEALFTMEDKAPQQAVCCCAADVDGPDPTGGESWGNQSLDGQGLVRGDGRCRQTRDRSGTRGREPLVKLCPNTPKHQIRYSGLITGKFVADWHAGMRCD